MQAKTRAVSRKTTSKGRAVTRTSSSARHGVDITGIVFVTLAIVILIALSMGGAGSVGDWLADAVRSVFGRLAWIAPIGLLVSGVSLIRGTHRMEMTRLSWGIFLLFLAVSAAFARAGADGNFLSPDMVATGGGYIGGAVAASLNAALGRAAMVGIGMLGAIGFALCLNTSVHEFLSMIKERAGSPIPKLKTVTQERAAVRMRSGDQEEELPRPARPVNEPETRIPERKTRQLTVRQTEQAPQTATMAGGMPKEGYTLPALTLLNEPSSKPRRSPEEMHKNIDTLERTLEEFGIDANVVEVATGPTITRYEVQLGPGIRVGRITALADNIAMNLAANQVRVEAPIPGKAAIGVEVPNTAPTAVTLRECCSTKEFMEHKSRLCIALGQDVAGQNRYTDLTKMPHLLIGGATNSGKSIGLATLIMSIIMRNTPKDVRMVMIDPKRVELSLFDGIPHLLCPVVKDVKEAPGVLRAIWREMDIRYDLFSEKGVRNIDGWNEQASFAEKLPYIVVVIDELADMMIQAGPEVETSIVRLAQLARAVGIHLVIATQRPSVDVITGLIKANIPSRIAFAVSSGIDSRTILDSVGAEQLVGKGDMLFLPIDASKPLRIQGCYVSEKEIERVCAAWRAQEKAQYVLKPIVVESEGKGSSRGEDSGDKDDFFDEAVRWVVDRGQASTSMLQRRFSIGFQRASRLIDMMEERGIIGPRDGPRPREVLITPDEVEGYLGNAEMPRYDAPDLSFMDEDPDPDEE